MWITLFLLFCSSVTGLLLEISFNETKVFPSTFKAFYLTVENIKQKTYSDSYSCISTHHSRDGSVSFTNYCELGACQFNEILNTNETLNPLCNIDDKFEFIDMWTKLGVFYLLINGCSVNGVYSTWVLTNDDQVNFDVFDAGLSQDFNQIRLLSDQSRLLNDEKVVVKNSSCSIFCREESACTLLEFGYSNLIKATILVSSFVVICGSLRFLYPIVSNKFIYSFFY